MAQIKPAHPLGGKLGRIHSKHLRDLSVEIKERYGVNCRIVRQKNMADPDEPVWMKASGLLDFLESCPHEYTEVSFKRGEFAIRQTDFAYGEMQRCSAEDTERYSLKGDKLYVRVRNSLCGFLFELNRQSIELASYFAITTRFLEPLELGLEKFMIRRSGAKTFFADREYNEIIGENDYEDLVIQEQEVEHVNEEITDHKLFKEFCRLVHEHLQSHTGETTFAKQMGAACFSGAVIDPSKNSSQVLPKRKRDWTVAQWLKIFDAYSPLALPSVKSANLSNGKPRVIFSLSPIHEAHIRSVLDGVSTTVEGSITSFKEVDKYLKYCYDIIGCDSRVGGYFLSYLKVFQPKLVDVLYPRTFCPIKKVAVRSKQLPSGVPHTKIIVELFTKSFCNIYCSGEFFFQGDGITSAQPIDHPWLRRSPDYVLNGFKKGVFINTHKIMQPAIIRPRSLRGLDRFMVRRKAYEWLGADVSDIPLPSDEVLGIPYASVTPRDIMQQCKNRGREVERIIVEIADSACYDPEKHNCDHRPFGARFFPMELLDIN